MAAAFLIRPLLGGLAPKSKIEKQRTKRCTGGHGAERGIPEQALLDFLKGTYADRKK